MIQQINLYQPIFRKERKVFSSQTVIQVAVIFIGALLLIYIYSLWQTTLLSRQLGALQKQEKEGTARLTQLEQSMPKGTADPSLVAALKQAETERDLKQQALNLVSTRSLGSTTGFDAQLEGLARQDVRGLWLTDIYFSHGGEQFTLEGDTQEGKFVPTYLARLSGEAAFKGMQFRTLSIEQPKDHGRALMFKVSTEAEKSNDKSSGSSNDENTDPVVLSLPKKLPQQSAPGGIHAGTAR